MTDEGESLAKNPSSDPRYAAKCTQAAQACLLAGHLLPQGEKESAYLTHQNFTVLRKPTTVAFRMRLMPSGSFGSAMPPAGRKIYWKSGCTVQPVMIWY